MAKFVKAIQCQRCGHIMDMGDLKDYCSNCSAPTGIKVFGSNRGEPSVRDWYFGTYRVSYSNKTMKPIITRKTLFGRLIYMRDLEDDDS